jgi:putative ABC transport system permease protein
MHVLPKRVRSRAELIVYCEEMAGRVRTIAGVRQASYARRIPLSGSGDGASVELSIPGVTLPEGKKAISVPYNQVAANFFTTVGVRILRGRSFDASDGTTGAKVALINQTMARRFWPNSDPIGQSVLVAGIGHQILGVVEDGKNAHLKEAPQPYLYFAFAQRPIGDPTLLIETQGEPGPMTAAIKRELRLMDSGIGFLDVMSAQDLVKGALWMERGMAAIGSTVGLLSILLAGIGLYGGLAFFVNQRRREIGVRLAVGAQRRDILRVVLARGLRLALIALPIGLGAAYAAARLMESMLYGVTPADPPTFLAAASIVLGVVLLASSVPAYRASRVDPVITLRYE